MHSIVDDFVLCDPVVQSYLHALPILPFYAVSLNFLHCLGYIELVLSQSGCTYCCGQIIYTGIMKDVFQEQVYLCCCLKKISMAYGMASQSSHFK